MGIIFNLSCPNLPPFYGTFITKRITLIIKGTVARDCWTPFFQESIVGTYIDYPLKYFSKLEAIYKSCFFFFEVISA